MTKAELLRVLSPYPDDTQLWVSAGDIAGPDTVVAAPIQNIQRRNPPISERDNIIYLFPEKYKTLILDGMYLFSAPEDDDYDYHVVGDDYDYHVEDDPTEIK